MSDFLHSSKSSHNSRNVGNEHVFNSKDANNMAGIPKQQERPATVGRTATTKRLATLKHQ
jgi:hypothetical protein